jgi:Kef-type K+ transport system membrane component KefB/nucleotide-binding universal stress UspA family protein
VNLVAPSEHQLLVFWTQLLVLLVVARLLGQAMRRIGQPAVVGQLGAGLLLGPSLLGRVAPGVLNWLVPADPLQSGMLFAVSWIGILLLLIETGFETDLALIRRLGKATALVSAGSIVLPLIAGLFVGTALPDVFRGELDDPTVFALFVGAALSISSLAVAGKVLSDLGLMRRNFGQVTLAAGMANDVVGWIMLGIVAALASAGEIAVGPLLVTVVGIAVLYGGGLTVGQRVVDYVLREVRRRHVTPTGYITVVLVIALVFGVATQLIGAEAVLGAFVAGIVVARSKFHQPEARETLERITAGVFAPIFFATAGLRVDLGLLADPEVLFWAVVVIGAASATKFIGAYLGAQVAGLPRREGVLLGIGLNPRGTLEIVIATVGLSLGVFNQASYTVILLMAILNSMAAPPLLRAVARSWLGTDEEQKRLQREESVSHNVMVRSHRLLLPSQGGSNSIVAAQLLHFAWLEDVEATVLSVGPDADEAGVQAVVDIFDDRPVSVLRVTSDVASDAILGEARLGYGAIGIGAPESSQGPWILSPVVDEILNQTAIPLIIVRRARNLDRPLPGAFARALVPVSAAPWSRAAQEIAFNLSANIGTEIVLTHVVTPSTTASGDARERRAGGSTEVADRRADVSGKLTERAEAFAEELGARARTVARAGPSPAEEIIAAAIEEQADLVVLGANLRRIEGRPFLSTLVEQVLEECDATVVVVATPSGPHG